MTDQPTPTADLIRAAIADAVTICNGPLIDHAASGVLYALGMTEIPPADGAPAPACGEECAESHTYTGRCAQTPVPYCGAYSPPLHIGGEPLIRLRCTLPVGHDHHHSDSHGTRWDNPRTAPDNPAASNNEGTCGYVKPHLPHQYLRLEVLGECPGVEAAGDDGLREQYAAAIVRGGGCVDLAAATNAVMAVRDTELQQARADMERYEEEVIGELNETNTALARRAEQAEAENRRLLAESPWLRASDEDRQTAETALAMQKGISADLRVESRTRGEKLATAEGAIARVQVYAHELRHKDAMGLLAALDGPADTTPPAEPGHLARLRAWLTAEAATCRRNAAAARHDETRQALDGMAAGHDMAVRVIDGLTAGKGLPVSGEAPVVEPLSSEEAGQ